MDKNEKLRELQTQIKEECFRCFPELEGYSREEKIQWRLDNTREPWFFEHEGLDGFYGTGKVMFVGQRPSSGKSGKSDLKVNRYYKLLKKHGFQNSHMTDLVKCRDKVGPLTKHEKTNCIQYFLKEVEIVQPKLIVGVGAEAYKVLKQLKLSISVVRLSHYSPWGKEPLDFAEKFEDELQKIREHANGL